MRIFFYLAFLCLAISSCQKESTPDFNYSVSPISDGQIVQLKINLQCAAAADGETTLLFQNQAWGQDSLHNTIAAMRLLNAEASITVQKDSGWIIIKHPEELKKLDFEYILQQDSKGDLTTRTAYRPIINEDYFHLFSHNMFMLPKQVAQTPDDRFTLKIDWNDFPENYTLQNSFGSQKRSQMIEDITEAKFHNAVFIGGDFRIHTLDIKGNEVGFAIRDDWKIFNDSTIVSVLEKTIMAQRNFYNDHSLPYYSVSMIPTVLENGSSFQGTGLTQSFALSASNNTHLEMNGLVYLLNHELQHNWTGSIIVNANEEEQYWFSEGFTDYYTIKIIAKEKINGLDKAYFVSEFNEFVKALHTSPVREEPNSALDYETVWSSHDYSKLPYRRGAIFAFWLDQQIMKDTQGKQSLDDLMFQFKKDAEASGQKINHDYFVKTANAFLKQDLGPFFDRHIENGKLIDLEAFYADLGFEFESEQEAFDLGFVFSEDRSEVLSIDTNSEAFKAGIRKGDKITSRSYYESAKHEATFKVLRNDSEVELKYFPKAMKNIPKLLESDVNFSKLGF